MDFEELEGKENILALIEHRTRISDIADTYAGAFWKFEAEEAKPMLLNTSESLGAARAVFSATHSDTANGNGAQDGKTRKDELGGSEDRGYRHLGLEYLSTLASEVWQARKDFQDEQFHNENPYLEYPNIIAKVARQRKKIINAATKHAEDASWTVKDKDVLLTGIEVAIVRDILITSLPWKRSTFYHGSITFLLDLFDRLDLASIDEPEATDDQSPASSETATSTSTTEQTTDLILLEQTAQTYAMIDPSEESDVPEREQPALTPTPVLPLLSRRPVSLRQWQEHILFIILGRQRSA